MRHMTAVTSPSLLNDVINHNGLIDADRLSAALRITQIELAAASGLSQDAVSKKKRLQAPAPQTRLREVAEIINRILPWCGSVTQAFVWYRSQPIPAFGDQTAEDL